MKKANKLILVFCLIVSQQNLHAQNAWQMQFAPVESNIVSVDFADSMYGWAATNIGKVIKTENSGVDWHIISQIEDATPSKIFFLNRDLGWMIGRYNSLIDSAFVMRTNNGGVSWEPVFQRLHNDLNDIFFINETTGWTVGSVMSQSDTISLIMYTTDGGDNWTMAPAPTVHSTQLYSIHFRDNNSGQACGQDGIFFSTNNGGINPPGWAIDISIPYYGADLYSIYNAGLNNGCAVGEDGLILFTKDKWANHLDNVEPSGETLLAVAGLPDGNRYWAVGKNGCIVSIRYALYMVLISEEIRFTWNNLNDICAVDENHIWAVGDNGTILFYSNNNNNNPPLAVDDEVSVSQDSEINIFPLDNDTDPDNDDLSIASFTEGQHGSVVVSLSGTYLHYDPDDDYIGMDTVIYQVTDGEGGSDTGSIFIEVIEADNGPFEQIMVNFDSVAFGNAIWGDIDNDNDYDIIVCGEKNDGTKVTSIYLNNDGTFEKAPVDLIGLSPRNDNSMAFIDLDMNGRLEFIITGESNGGGASTILCNLEDDHSITYWSTGIEGVKDGSVDWGDYDNDGDMDLLISGLNSSDNKICKIYRNNGQSDNKGIWDFIDISASFVPMDESVARFIDFNKDDFLDIIAMGTDENNKIKGYYYTNQNGVFSSQEMQGHKNGSIDFCDFDSDGNVEIVLTGDTSNVGAYPYSCILEYSQDSFINYGINIEGLSLSSADWGDYDNDGDYDLIVSGMDSQLGIRTELYINDNNTLVNSGIIFPGMASGTVCWGDYDNDNDLDLLFSGYFNNSPNRITTIFINTLEIQNNIPIPPQNISVNQLGDNVSIMWDMASDSETSAESLTYNVKLKRKYGYSSSYVMRPPVRDDGTLRTTIVGNAFDNKIIISGLEKGALYTCLVQSIDAGFQGSPWSEFDFNTASDYFIEQDYNFHGYDISSAHWLDYDSDMDLDLFTVGTDELGIFSVIYPVNDNELDEQYINSGDIVHFKKSSVFDFDNDNIPDYSSGIFSDSTIRISVSGSEDILLNTGMDYGLFDWGDYENDGDMDLIIIGSQGFNDFTSKLFRNNNGVLENHSILIPGVVLGDIEWVDFDSDNDLDIAYCGVNEENVSITRIYENRDGAFVNTEMEILGMAASDMDFADYDEDGDLDLLICGLSEAGFGRTIIYENENNTYFPVPHYLAPIVNGSCKWVDLNGDGFQDIVLSGVSANTILSDNVLTKIYLWMEGSYIDVATLQGYTYGIIAAGDYNGDKMVDLFIAGDQGSSNSGILYKNVIHVDNYDTYPPDSISVTPLEDQVKIEWNRAFGGSDWSDKLSYNLRIGTSPGGSEILSPLAGDNGFRKVVGMGNAGYKRFSKINDLHPDSVYYMAIQSINASYRGSVFSEEIAFSPFSGSLVPGEIIMSDKNITEAEFIDYDDDEYLELLVRQVGDIGTASSIYENDNGDLDTAGLELLTGVFTDELLLNDFDNDNDIDLLLMPKNLIFDNIMLENSGGIFNETNLDIEGLSNSNSAWGDFDNDGDLDIIINGADESGLNLHTFLYKNNNGVFESYDNLMQAVLAGKIQWIDIDSDGDKDIVRCGYTKTISPGPEDVKFIISENIRGAFRDIYPDIPGLTFCDMDFGDYDLDGDLDMVYCGWSMESSQAKTYIYTNQNGVFNKTDSITPVFAGKVKWVDIDNNNHPDIIITGYNDDLANYLLPEANMITEVFLNTGDGFINYVNLETFLNPTLAVGDYNDDGRIDVFVGGEKNENGVTGIVYNNSHFTTNVAPGWPNVYDADITKDSITIHWRMPVETSLYYNLRIGTTPGGNDILSSLSHEDGKRKFVNYGNMQLSKTFTLRSFSPSTRYYYSVQSIDKGLKASRWSFEKEFISLATSIKINKEDIGIKVYPNPAVNRIVVDDVNGILKEDLTKITLISVNGSIVRSKSEFILSRYKREINITDIESGLYILKIENGDLCYTSRIVVMK